MSRFGVLASFGVAALLAGCATAPPAAVTTYAAGNCAEEPNLAEALALTPKSPQASFTVTTKIDRSSPCLHLRGQSGPYAVYALPAARDGKTLTVGALLEQARLVPPAVATLDGKGKVLRAFPTSDLFFRSDVYSVQFQPKADEAFILVTTDQARVGQSYESIFVGTTTTTAGNGASWRSGVDQKIARTFSYEGALQVTVHDALAAAHASTKR